MSLSKTAELMLNINDVAGATYDENTGQIIFFGKENLSLPQMDIDDLSVAVNSVYAGQDPGVSIGTEPSEYPGWMKVRYDGLTRNTSFGKVMFDADRLLKCLSLGYDNVTRQTVSSGVSGYENMIQRELYGSGESGQQTAERMWFKPKDMKLTKSDTGDAMVFSDVSMELLTEATMQGQVITNPEGEAFASHFTSHYDEFAGEFSVLKELKRLGKITSVVKWIRDNNIPLDLSFLNNYAVTYVPTESYTPEISVSGTRTWWVGNTKYTKTITMIGGVSFEPPNEYLPDNPSDPVTDGLKSAAIAQRPSEETFAWDFQGPSGSGSGLSTDDESDSFKAVAQSVAKSRKDGNFETTRVDMSFPVTGDFSLELVRYYNSFNEKKTGFGYGWSAEPFEIRFPGPKYLFSFGTSGYQRYCYYKINVIDRMENREDEYTLLGIDNNDLPIYTRPGSVDLLRENDDSTLVLTKMDKTSVTFGADGRISALKDKNNNTINFNYSQGKLVSLSHPNGRTITLTYNGSGKITRADGPAGRAVTYNYDASGNLSQANDIALRPENYTYNIDHQVTGITDKKSNPVYANTYDIYNRAAQKTINGDAGFSSEFSLQERKTITTRPDGIQTIDKFDSEFRPVEKQDALKNLTQIEYDGDYGPAAIKDGRGLVTRYQHDIHGNVTQVTNDKGETSKLYYNYKDELVARTDPNGFSQVYLYDDHGNMVTIYNYAVLYFDDEGNLISYGYDPDDVSTINYDSAGSPITITDANHNISNISYDSNGMVTGIEKASGLTITQVHDSQSRLTEIRDGAGHNATFGYDTANNLSSVTTSAGTVNYEYDANNNLTKIIDARTKQTQFGYDTKNNLSSVLDAKGNTTTYTYDVFNNLTQASLPNGTSFRYMYDENNRKIASVSGASDTPFIPEIATLPQDTIDFGRVNAGSQEVKTLKIYNIGLGDLVISDIETDNSAYMTNFTGTITIHGGDIAEISVTFAPTTEGTINANLTVISNDSDEGTLTISLTGSAGTPSVSNVQATPTVNGIQLSWNQHSGPAGNFNHYNIYKSTAPFTNVTGIPRLNTNLTDPAVTTYTDGDVQPGVQYYYAVTVTENSGAENTEVNAAGPVTYFSNFDRIGDGFGIAQTSANEKSSSIAYNSVNRQHLTVFEARESDGVHYDIKGQLLDAVGNKIGSTFTVTPYSGTDERRPQVVYNPTRNEYLVTYEHYWPTYGKYFACVDRVSASGTVLTGGVLVLPYVVNQYNPRVAYNSTNDEYLVVCEWDQNGNGSDMNIACQTMTGAASRGSYNAYYISSFIGMQELKPDVAYNRTANEYYVVWECNYSAPDNYDILGRRISRTGVSADSTIWFVGGFNVPEHNARIVYNTTNNKYFCAYEIHLQINGIYNYYLMGQSLSAAGSKDGNYNFISYYVGIDERHVALAYNPAGNEYLAVFDSDIYGDHSASAILGRRISAGGSLIGGLLVGFYQYNVYYPSIAYDSYDNNYIVTMDYNYGNSGTDWDVIAQRVGPESPILHVVPSSLTFAGTDITKTITITNTGNGNLDWGVYPDHAWMTASPQFGSAQTEADTVTITVDRAGLPPATYNVYCDIVSDGGQVHMPVTVIVANTPPNAPSAPQPANGSSNQSGATQELKVGLSWTSSDPDPGDTLSYDVYLSKNQALVNSKDPSALVSLSQTPSNYTTATLDYSSTYYWRITAKDNKGGLTDGPVWSFGTIAAQTPVLIPYMPNPTNNARPLLDWYDVVGAVKYHLQISASPDFNPLIVNDANIIASEYRPASNLPEGAIYWRVAGIDALGAASPFSNPSQFTLDLTAPGQVTLIPYAPDPTRIRKPTLTWNAVTGAQNYHLQVSNSSAFTALLTDKYVSGTQWTLDSDLPEGVIWWRVSAKDLAGNEGIFSLADSFTVDVTPPAAINIISAVSDFVNITLTWSPFTDIGGDFSHFNIYREESLIINTSALTPINQSIGNSGITTFVDNTVTSSKAYYYAVTAVDIAGNENKNVICYGPVSLNGNTPPYIEPAIPNIKVPKNTTITVDLSPYKHDHEEGSERLVWSISGVNESLMSAAINPTTNILTITPVNNAMGADTVTFTLTDSGGLTATQNTTITVSDFTPPTVDYFALSDIDSLSTTYTNSRDVAVAMYESSTGSGVAKWLINESANQPLIDSFTLTSRPVSYHIQGSEGTVTVYAWVMDRGDNISVLTQKSVYTITLDLTAPRVSPSAVVVDATHVQVTYNEPVLLAETASNYSINDMSVSAVSKTNPTTYRLTLAAPQEEGKDYTIRVSNITDLAGNIVDAAHNTASFRGYDIHPPAFSGIASAAPQDSAIILEWKPATDATEPVKYNIYQSSTPGGEIFSFPSFVTFDTRKKIEGLFNGQKYYFVVRSEDDAGNEDANTVELSASPTNNVNAWSLIGLSGQSLQSLAIDEVSPANLYAGTASSGVYKSADSGASWAQDNSGITDLNIQKIAVDPSNHNILYAGSNSGNIYKKSAAWSAIRTGSGNPVKDIAVSPADSNIIFAATWGEKLIKTINDGTAWTTIGPALSDNKVNAVLMARNNPSAIYIGTESDGIFKSIDTGMSFTAINSGLGNLSVKSLAMDPQNSDVLYAGTNAGIYKSINGGTDWQRIGASYVTARVNSIDIDEVNMGILYIGTDSSGVYRSTTGGNTWVAINNGLSDLSIAAIAIDHKHSSIVWCALKSGGVFTRIVQNLLPQISGVSISPTVAYKTSAIQAAATGWSDADLDAEGYSYEWYSQAGPIPGAASQQLENTFFNKGDEVYCKVKPFDGFDYGNTIETNHVTILNSVPVIDGAIISPSTAYKTTTLVASGVNWSDADGDPESYIYEWHNQSGIIAGVTGNTLPTDYFIKHNHIYCVITPYDGQIYGVPKTTPTIEIQNSFPQANLIRPNGGEVWKGIHNIEWAASDPDFDTVLISLYYQSNGGAWQPIATGLANSGTYQWDTSALPDGINSYLVKVVATDGENERIVISANPFTLNNQPPQAPQNVSAGISGDYINVSWNPVSGSDIAGYKIYYGASPGSYTEVRDVANPGAFTYQFLIRDVRGALGTYPSGMDESGSQGAGAQSSSGGVTPPGAYSVVSKIKPDDYVKDEIIVKLKTEAGEQEITLPDSVRRLNDKFSAREFKNVFPKSRAKRAKLNKFIALDAKTNRTIPDLSAIYLVKLPKNSDIKKIIEEYKTDPNVEYAEPNYKVHALSALTPEHYYFAVTSYDNMANESAHSTEASVEYLPPDDKYYRTTGTWGQSYKDMWGLDKMNIQEAWSIEKGTADIVVAVVDTGCDYNHEDLSGNIWTNTDEVAGNGVDDDGNGFVDDIRGWDFIGANADTPIQDNNPMDGHGHGTHVSGTIAAATDNYKGIAGISWHTKIMPVKVLDDSGSGSVAICAQGIRYAADNGARVINNSWGGFGDSLTVKNAVDYAYAHGCVVVVAAGNSNEDALYSNPSNCENAITVSAFNTTDTMAYFSNWGAKIDVAAPGVDILSLRAAGTGSDYRTVGGNYYRMSGTSMACPHVAGLAALILSKNPAFTPGEVRQIIRASSSDTGPTGRDDYAGFGRIDAYAALQVNSISLANITSPVYNSHISGTFDIAGIAKGTNFEHYIIEYGPGDNPSEWSSANITLSSGGMSQVTNGVLGTINTDSLEEGDWTIRLSVSDSGGVTSKDYRTITVDGSLHTNWPKNLEYNDSSSPVYADLDNNGNVKIILCTKSDTTSQGAIHVWNSNGTYASGWPKTIDSPLNTSAAVGDINGDGKKEIVVAAYDPEYLTNPGSRAHIFAWKSNGAQVSGWPKSNDYPSEYSSPVLADLNQDGQLDIIICGTKGNNGRVYAYKADGSVIPGWPIDVAGKLESTPAVGDIDGDGEVEVVAITGGTDAKAYAWHKNGVAVAGWPRQLDGYRSQKSSPALCDIDLDGKNDVIIGITDEAGGVGHLGKVYVLKGNGTNLPGWPQYTGSEYVQSSPCTADIDNNGSAEIIVGSSYDQRGSVHVWRRNGTYMPGWPKNTGSAVISSPIAADINGDGHCEIIVGTGPTYCKLHIWDVNGNEMAGWPKRMEGMVNSSPAIGDVDGDGKFELFASPWGGKIYQWDLAGTATEAKMAWPMFHQNAEHTGLYLIPNYAPSISGIPDKSLDEDTSLIAAIDLYSYVNDPNNTNSELTFTITASTNPACGAVISSNRYIDITPALHWHGSSDITVRVTDPGGLYAEDTFHVTVTHINHPPVINPPVPDPAAVDEDTPVVIQLTPYEMDVEDSGINLKWTVLGLTNCAVSGQNSDDDTLTFTPEQNYYGQVTATLVLTDSEGASATQNIVLTWNPVNDPPVISPLPDKTMNEGESVIFVNLDDYVTDPDNAKNELVWNYSGNDKVEVSIDATTHVVTLNSNAGWHGDESVTFTVRDPGGLSSSCTVLVTVVARYGSVSGTVTDEIRSLPIAGICVKAYNWDTDQLVDSALTLSDGTYSIKKLTPGNYRIYADPQTLDYGYEYYNNTETKASATMVPITLSANAPNINFILPVLEELNITIHSAFNPICFAVMPQGLPSPYKASRLIQDMALCGVTLDIVMQWDQDRWLSYQVDLPFTDFDLDLGQGIFIRSPSEEWLAGMWAIRGKKMKLPNTIDLREGWNLVNIPTTLSTTTVIQALQEINSQGGTADVMMWWDGDWWISTQVDLPFTDQELVKGGRSYFIRCYSNSRWEMR